MIAPQNSPPVRYRPIGLPLAALAGLTGLEAWLLRSRSVEDIFKVHGLVLLGIALAGLVLALRRARQVPAEAAGWRWMAASFLVGLGQALVVSLESRNPAQALPLFSWWYPLALASQLTLAIGILVWPFRVRNASRLLLHVLGSILFCGSLLLQMWGLVDWRAVLAHHALLNSMLVTNSVRVCLLGGVSLCLLADHPARWRGPLGFVLLGAMGGALASALLFLNLHDRVWLFPLLLTSLLPTFSWVLAAWSGRPVEPATAGPEVHPLRWELLPNIIFVSAAGTVGFHLATRANASRGEGLALIALMVPLLLRQFMLFREVRRDNEDLEVRVAARTRDLEWAHSLALRETAERRNAWAAVDQSRSAIIITGLDGVIEYANPAFTRLTGYSRAELLGARPSLLKSGEHSEGFYRRLWATVTQGETWEGRFHNRRKDGSLYWDKSVITPICGEDGRIQKFVASKEDITAQLAAEDERLRLEAQVRTAQKMDSIGNLAGGVAHDMNNVLGAILGIASVQACQAEPGSPLRKGLDTIDRACVRGRTLVQKLLRFSRRDLAEVATLDLNSLVREGAALLERTTLQRISLRLDLTGDALWVRGDPGALSHALMNLCVNAVDAMPEGGELILRTSRSAAGVVLEVQDCGCGMPAAVLAKAMEPFFTTKPLGQGTGLGLPLVYSTVKAHDGKMDLTSSPGCGTLVRIELPDQETGPAAPLAPPDFVPGQAPSLRILIVDDDELIQESLIGQLEAMGHGHRLASRGEEALEWLETEAFDLVMLDLNMPGLGGHATLIRLIQRCPDLPVLIITGKPDPELRNQMKHLGTVRLLPKPFSAGELQRAIGGIPAGAQDPARTVVSP